MEFISRDEYKEDSRTYTVSIGLEVLLTDMLMDGLAREAKLVGKIPRR
jgi:hypothetical protein